MKYTKTDYFAAFAILVLVSSMIYGVFSYYSVYDNRPDTWKDVYIKETLLMPSLFHEGMDFKFAFSIANNYPATGYVEYEYIYPYDCLELNGTREGRLNLKASTDDTYQAFYTEFHIKENLTAECYGRNSYIEIWIKNSEEILDTEKVDIDFAIPMHMIEKIEQVRNNEKENN